MSPCELLKKHYVRTMRSVGKRWMWPCSRIIICNQPSYHCQLSRVPAPQRGMKDTNLLKRFWLSLVYQGCTTDFLGSTVVPWCDPENDTAVNKLPSGHCGFKLQPAHWCRVPYGGEAMLDGSEVRSGAPLIITKRLHVHTIVFVTGKSIGDGNFTRTWKHQ